MDTKQTNSPRFSHDCDCCAFVARIAAGTQGATSGDLWVCLRHRELIVRYSARADHYSAMGIRDARTVVRSCPTATLWVAALGAFEPWQATLAAV